MGTVPKIFVGRLQYPIALTHYFCNIFERGLQLVVCAVTVKKRLGFYMQTRFAPQHSQLNSFLLSKMKPSKTNLDFVTFFSG